MSIILNADSYKSSHYLQYPPRTEHVSSYIEARTGSGFQKTLFFGLQAFLKEYWSKPITGEDIDKAREILTSHGEPFNIEGWRHILNAHGGRLPLEIEALPEGSTVDRGNCLVQVVNTDERVPWLTSYVETSLLRAVWYPTTVATISWYARQTIMHYLEKTCDDPAGQIDFKLHDFGARGVSSLESAGIGGLAHLVNFNGTDTLSAILSARKYYGSSMAGFSVPAAEHSTITSWGRDGEEKAYQNMIDQFGRGALVAIVADSYDLSNAVQNIFGKNLKQDVESMNATLVVRPDSGNPAEIVLQTAKELADAFGCSKNEKGYYVLNPKVRIIQGDGVDVVSIGEILRELEIHRFSAENVSFGMGGGLLQRLDRDTLRFAMKASAVQCRGMWREVFKKPITDPTKSSMGGRLAVIQVDGAYRTVKRENLKGGDNLLRTIWKDGNLLEDFSLEEIRARARR